MEKKKVLVIFFGVLVALICIATILALCFGLGVRKGGAITPDNQILILNNTAAPINSFMRNWADYKKGFGSPSSGVYWIGNDLLHNLTATGLYSLHVDMLSLDTKWYYANYTNFTVEDEANGYRLHVSGYQGNAGDAFHQAGEIQDGAVFYTPDKDLHGCAASYSGFWFNNCCSACPTATQTTQYQNKLPEWDTLVIQPQTAGNRNLQSVQMTLVKLPSSRID